VGIFNTPFTTTKVVSKPMPIYTVRKQQTSLCERGVFCLALIYPNENLVKVFWLETCILLYGVIELRVWQPSHENKGEK